MQKLYLGSIILSSITAVSLAFENPASKTHDISLNGHNFTLPIGFTIELAAGPPLVDRPITADFDEQGRLYVSDSSGSNEPVQEQLKKKPHRILRLEDVNGDGRFDKRTVFAEHMMFPEGTLWHAGSLYVAAPPSIWKLTDTKGDGIADQRVEWFQGKTLTGCANDLHGPYLGPDGWIYWCKGAFARQTYPRPGKPPLVTRAAHIFRCRPDGTGIEPVMTGGMDNPVEVAFAPGGERIFTTTFFQHPGGGQRDGLVHAIYGGVYGKDHDVVHEHPWTSPALMPVLTQLGPAAPCGLLRYESDVFGKEYQDSLFACQFNMHKVSRHVLVPDGASFKTRDEDFLVSSNVDFHPTHIIEDADGSLLVIDTGGWYKLCCPTSWLHKPDILGAIYRVRRIGATKVDDPRGTKLPWSRMSANELTALLGDPRPAVRRRAVLALRAQPGDITSVLATAMANSAVEIRRNAIWAATLPNQSNSTDALVRERLLDADETVRQAAIQSISVRRDKAAVPDLLQILKTGSPQNQRAAAEALGRLGESSAVPALLETLGTHLDRAREHSLTYALIEIGDRQATAVGLKSSNPRTRRAALTALDQMPGGMLDPRTLAADLSSPEAALKDTAWWIAYRHPEWGSALAGILGRLLDEQTEAKGDRGELIRRLARFARAPVVQDFLAERLTARETTRWVQVIILKAMAQSDLKEAPARWTEALVQLFIRGDGELASWAATTARSLHYPRQRPETLISHLLRVARIPDMPAAVRLEALAAIPGGLAAATEPSLFEFLCSQLSPDGPAANRGMAADVLARAHLNRDQLLVLAESIRTAGPMETDRLLEAFAHCADDAVGLRLLESLQASPVRSSLRVEMIKPRLAKFGPEVHKQAERLYALLNVDAEKQKAHLESLLASMSAGDPRRGQVVFQSSKAACTACHAIGYVGGTVGPDLTHIGKIRTERDLLEAVVFPSASFVRSYEPVVVTTKDGRLYNGVIRKDAADEVILATGINQEVRVARDDIEAVQPSKVSIMPAGLEQQLSSRELADLVAFLKACK